MSKKINYNWTRIREHILADSFCWVSEDEAVALIGIFHEYRIYFSEASNNVSVTTLQWEPLFIDPLDIQSICITIEEQCGNDCDEIFHAYQSRSKEIKNTETFDQVKRTVEENAFVGHLVCYNKSK